MAQKVFESPDMRGGFTDEFIESDQRFVEKAENLCLDPSGDVAQRPGSHLLEGSDPKAGSFVDSNTPVTNFAEFEFNNQAQNYLACVNNTGSTISLFSYTSQGLVDPKRDMTTPFFTPHEGFNNDVWQSQPFFANSTVAAGLGNYPTKLTTDAISGLPEVITAGLPTPYDFPNNPDGMFKVGYLDWSPDIVPGTYTLGGAVGELNSSQFPTGLSNEFRVAVTFVREYSWNGVTYRDVSKPYISAYLRHPTGKKVGYFPNNTNNDGGAYTDYYAMYFYMRDDLTRKTNGIQWQTNWASHGGIKVQIFRTVDAGNVFYDMGQSTRTYEAGTGKYGSVIPVTVGTENLWTGDFPYGDWGQSTPPLGAGPIYTVFNDKALVLNPTLYTTGGVLDNDLPPRSKYCTLVNDNYMYWVDATNPYRVLQSHPRDPDSVPAGNFIDFPAQVTGLSSAGGKLIVTTLNATYRVDGFYDEFGRGTVVADKISSETGCISHNSMVRVADGLFFCGIDGFYYTNGQTVLKISRHLSKNYYRLTQTELSVTNEAFGSITTVYGKKYVITENQAINGCYDKISNRVLWSFLGGVEVIACEKALGINEKMSFFGPWKLAPTATTENVFARSLGTFKNKIVRSDAYGNVFQLEEGVSSDPKPIALNPQVTTNWLAADRYPIIYALRTQTNYLGSRKSRKWVTGVDLRLKRADDSFIDKDWHDRNLDVLVTSINDKGRIVQDLKPIHYSTDLDFAYVNAKSYNGLVVQDYDSEKTESPLVSVSRRFMAKGLRCVSKAIELKPGFKLLADSANYEPVNYLNSGGIAASLPSTIWSKHTYTGTVITEKLGLMDSVDHTVNNYYLTLDIDGYKTLYPITMVGGTGMTANLGTPYLGSAAVSGTYAWKLYSIPKNQFFGISSYSLTFTDFESKSDDYTNQGSGNEP